VESGGGGATDIGSDRPEIEPCWAAIGKVPTWRAIWCTGTPPHHQLCTLCSLSKAGSLLVYSVLLA
jgi:hypothetical protein